VPSVLAIKFDIYQIIAIKIINFKILNIT